MGTLQLHEVLLEEKKDAQVILNNIKKMLMSRTEKLQLEAVYSIVRSLQCSTSENNKKNFYGVKSLPDILLDADITEFLCEAMATMNSCLLEAIFVCMEYLSRSEKFYKNNHVTPVMECVIHSVFFLLKQNNYVKTLNKALILLAVLLRGHVDVESQGTYMFTFDVGRILEMITIYLSERRCNTNEITLRMVWVFCSLLQNHYYLAMQLDTKLLECLTKIIEDCLPKLSELASSNREVDLHMQGTRKDVVLLISNMTCSILRLNTILRRKEVENQMEYSVMMEKFIGKAIRLLLEFIQDVCAPYIVEIDIEESNMELFLNFFTCLKTIYQDSEKHTDTVLLSFTLGELGFLTLVPVISSWASKKYKEWGILHSVCLTLLEEMLFSMSVNTLEVSTLWPGGETAYREHLTTGLRLLPLDYAQWLRLLRCQDIHSSLRHTLIVLFFFCCLCASSSTVSSPFFPAVLSFLNGLSSIPSLPIPLIKALWFLFAASSLSNDGQLHKEYGTNVLLHLLESQADIRNVYIHHPALLHWAFSSPCINSHLQKKVLKLWLEEEPTDDTLIDLVIANPAAGFCLIDLVQCSKQQVVSKALNVLNAVMKYQAENGKDDLLLLLWEILPQVLTRLVTSNNAVQAGNVGGLLQLASRSVPQNLNISTVVRGAYLLTRVLARQLDPPLSFYKAAIDQASLFLLVSMELQDKRALVIFMNEPVLLDILRSSIESSHTALCCKSLTFLSYLLKYQEKHDFVKSDGVVQIEGKQILQLLGSPDMNILTASLQLVFSICDSRLRNPVATLLDKGFNMFSPHFLQTLFIKLQVLCTKNFPYISSVAWKCLGGLLNFSATHSLETGVQLHLATQPWTHFLICITAQNSSVSRSHHFLYFISQWLKCKQLSTKDYRFTSVHFSHSKKRALCPSWLSETISEVADMILNHKDFSSDSPATKELIVHITNGILKSGVDLPDGMKTKLNQFVSQVEAN